jgi:uncharacterized protein YutD
MNIVDDKVYNSVGGLIGYLDSDLFSTPENVIIPFPGSTCKFIVLSTMNSTGNLVNTNSNIVDLAANNNQGSMSTDLVLSSSNANYRDIVVGNLNVNNERLFYTIDVNKITMNPLTEGIANTQNGIANANKLSEDLINKQKQQLFDNIIPPNFKIDDLTNIPGANILKPLIVDIIKTSVGEETKLMMDEIKTEIVKNVPELFKSDALKNASYKGFNNYVLTFYNTQKTNIDIKNFENRLNEITDTTKKQTITDNLTSLLNSKQKIIEDALKDIETYVIVGGEPSEQTNASSEQTNLSSDQPKPLLEQTNPSSQQNNAESSDILINISKSILKDTIGKETKNLMQDIKGQVISCIPGVFKSSEIETAAVEGFNTNILKHFNDVLQKFDKILGELKQKDTEIEKLFTTEEKISGGKRKTIKRGRKKGKTRRRIYRGIV